MAPRTPFYRVVLADLASSEIVEVPFGNLQYSFTLNESGSISFTVPIEAPEVTKANFAAGEREVHIYRAQTLVWGGRLWNCDFSTESAVQCSGTGYFETLKSRTVDSNLSYNNTDQFDIAWNLINFTQGKPNGDLGITRAGGTSGINRDMHFPDYERANIGETLQSMSVMARGFDFNVDQNKVWHPYYPSRGSSNVCTFELGKNINSMQYTVDATGVRNEVTAIGGGEGDSTCIATSSDSSSRSQFGLLQETISNSDIRYFASLQDIADEELRIAKRAREQPQLQVVTDDPPFGSYSPGDKCTVRASHGFINLNQLFRILSITVAVSNEGREAIGVYFDEATDL